MNDKRLMDLREHVGLATAELFQMLQELYAGVPPQELWEECQRLRRLILDESGNTECAMPHVFKLLDLIEAGADAAAKREEIRKQQEHIRKLVTAERIHLEKERELMSMEAFVVNLAILAEGMKLFFQEEDILRFKLYMQANIMGLPGNAIALIDTKVNPN